MSMTKISTVQEWEKLLKDNEHFYFLKNSTTCPISTQAFSETENFSEEEKSVPVFYLDVQEARSLSNEIANRLNVKHESPQAFLIQDGEVKWHDSHWNVTKETLARALNQ
ncbi:bacillithiol system redox-active protein YtxJ [Bacillus sp. H-16]|uniref:bacillithiol system redox-active protein YtxJ n=1 Tax=Alteribacter salitolerans TaxID=2912333 RepID=UPI001963FB0F|nr:bacillithiol system redox-active protein YtxJ [Alteribacter salitolerans]MBM7096406.1 bacillithiol system redox-active protein YtxJ [Alteribacter salitolerans]